jgi:hypothetical protein
MMQKTDKSLRIIYCVLRAGGSRGPRLVAICHDDKQVRAIQDRE